MQPHQRSKVNNQTDNGANEKGTPGASGRTTGGTPDHTYPRGAAQQQDAAGSAQRDTWQSGAGPGVDGDGSMQRASGADLPGGSMQTQQSGGSGAQLGITDSHQQQMMQRSSTGDDETQPAGAARSGQPRQGSSGATSPGGNVQQADSHLTGAQNAAALHKAGGGVHASNDVGGGYPLSPGGANQLAADDKMDDDTGLSNPRR